MSENLFTMELCGHARKEAERLVETIRNSMDRRIVKTQLDLTIMAINLWEDRRSFTDGETTNE